MSDQVDIRVRLPAALLARIDAVGGNRSEEIAKLLEESFKDFDSRKVIAAIIKAQRL